MKLTLMINGEEKIFVAPFIPAKHYRQMLKFDQEIDYFKMTLEDYDKLVSFVCDVFGNQFTVDEFYEGIASHELDETLVKVFAYVRTGEVPKKDVDTKNEKGK